MISTLTSASIITYIHFLNIQAGLGSLFAALVLFDADYHSLGLHFQPVCMVRRFNVLSRKCKDSLVADSAIKLGILSSATGKFS